MLRLLLVAKYDTTTRACLKNREGFQSPLFQIFLITPVPAQMVIAIFLGADLRVKNPSAPFANDSPHSRANTLFCGQNCRAKFYRQEAAASRTRECVCGNCGKAFITTRRDVKYCCEACQREAHRKMRKEREPENKPEN